MPKIAFPLTLGIVLAASTIAHAAPKCTAEPKDKWMSEQAMKAKVAELVTIGSRFRRMTSGNSPRTF